MSKTPIKHAILLAAGRGSRLRPYTDTIPKPLLPVRGVPTLDLYFESLATLEVEHAIIIVHHLAEQLDNYASQVKARYGITCHTVTQQLLDGTASALQSVVDASVEHPALRSAHSMQSIRESPFLLTATDYLISKTFIADLLSFYDSIEETIAISIKSVPQEELSARSSLRFNSDGQILEVVEKPPAGTAPSQYSANLTYVLPPDIFGLLPDVPMSDRGEREIQSAINRFLANGGTARGLLQTAPPEWTPDLLPA